MAYSMSFFELTTADETMKNEVQVTSFIELQNAILTICDQKHFGDDDEKCLLFENNDFINNKRYSFNFINIFDGENNDGYLIIDCSVYKGNVETNPDQNHPDSDEEASYHTEYKLPLSSYNKAELLKTFDDFYTSQIIPDFSKWENLTTYSFFATMGNKGKAIFNKAYRLCRKNNTEIFRAFSFKHLSDVTQYYFHSDNQSTTGVTQLTQSVGEAISLFQMIFTSIMNMCNTQKESVSSLTHGLLYKVVFDNEGTKDETCVGYYIDINLDDTWRQNKVVPENVYGYKATLGWNNTFCINPFDNQGQFLSVEEALGKNELYKYLPMFLLCIIREIDINPDYKHLLIGYCENPSEESFVRLHEDLVQKYIKDVFYLISNNFSKFSITTSEFILMNEEFERKIKNQQKEKQILSQIQVTEFSKSDFSAEYQFLIPNLPKHFKIDRKLLPICNALVSEDSRAVLLHGPAGTGKTIACKLMCQSIKLPIMQTVNCTENLDEFILGKYIPKDDKIVFQESYVTKAIRFGGAVVFEEINFAKPQHLSFLNSLLDDNGFVRLDNGEIVKRNKNFRFFATMNIGYFGTRELNQALYNRFNAIIELDELSDEAITNMLVASVPESIDCAEKMLCVYHKLKDQIISNELDYVISPRNLDNWARLAKYEGYIKASEQTIIPIAKNDRPFEKAIRSLIDLYTW